MAEEKKKEELLQDDVVTAAQQTIAEQQNRGGYQSQWQNQLDDAMNKILNREEFSYDLNGDALYQQYKDRYIKQGQQAMMDTVGQQAMLTGGYGNSWAQTAGQQAYQGYLGELNEMVPQLQQLALDKYNAEGDELYNRYALFTDANDRDYEKYLENEDLKKWLATQDEETRNYYLNYGKEPEENAGDGYSGGTTGTIGRVTSKTGSNSSGGKTIDQLAQEVIAGKWGNGTARKNALEEAGYDYAAVQAAVNKLMAGETPGGGEDGENDDGVEASSNYQNIESEIVKSVATGNVGASDIAQALMEEYRAGNITYEEYMELYEKHVRKDSGGNSDFFSEIRKAAGLNP
ncbi:MAG: hypothetical protein IJ306_01185 [Oscillospiraceae bacterium]|nr:hypothetical protein [Oscillospiraceae bacterium]